MTERPSLVLHLQDLAQSDSTPIGELLRKAKTVAVKLGQPEVSGWLDHEANGYGAEVAIPEYRRVTTLLRCDNRFTGPIPIILPPEPKELSDHYASFLFPDPAHQAAVFASANPGSLRIPLSSEEFAMLTKLNPELRRFEIYRLLNVSNFPGIVSAVRNRILDWALELEQREVMGWGMTFTTNEKAAGAGLSINVSNVVSSPGAASATASGNARVTQKVSNALPPEVASALTTMADALRTETELQANQRSDALEQLEFLKQQCETIVSERSKPGVIKGALASLKLLAETASSVKAAWVTFGPVVTGFLQTGSAMLGAG